MTDKEILAELKRSYEYLEIYKGSGNNEKDSTL